MSACTRNNVLKERVVLGVQQITPEGAPNKQSHTLSQASRHLDPNRATSSLLHDMFVELNFYGAE